ncbi:hypothetical protein Tco_1227703 [Tanacetum coccineum]
MGGLWRDTRLSFLSLNDEQNHRYAALHVDSKSVEYRKCIWPNTFGISSSPASFPVRCFLKSYNSFSLPTDHRRPWPMGWSSFPVGLRSWFYLSFFIVVLTEARLIIGLGLAKVEARYANDVFSGLVAENTVVITVGRVVLRLFDLVRMGLIVAGHMDGTTDYANMGMIRLRRDRRVLVMVAGLPSLHVADSHTGNHPKDDFTPLETIQRPYCVIRKRIPFELEGETFEPDRGLRTFQVRGMSFPLRSLSLYAPLPSASTTSYGPSHLGPSFPSYSAWLASLFRYTRSPGLKLVLQTLEL